MASRGPSSRSAYVLLKDVEAMKQSSGFKKMIGVGKFSVVNVHRGELLIQVPKNERQQCGDGPLLNYCLFKDPNILLYSGEENVSPLGEHDFKLLEAITSTNDRYHVFSHPDKLYWGASLRQGSRVFVKIPYTQIVAAAIIRCKGSIESLPGINFGVEITDPQYRGQGSTYGVYRGIEYFQCDPNCGLFVSLERLSAEPFVKSSSEQSYAGTVADQKARTDPHLMETNQKANEQRPKIEIPFERCNFRIGDRVIARDKQGKAVHGKIVWAGRNPGARELGCMYVGIETATQVRYTEFIGALPGLAHVASTPKGHFLALPQLLVEKYAEPTKLPPQAKSFEAYQDPIDTENTKAIAARLGESYTQLMAAQIQFDENKKALDDERIKNFREQLASANIELMRKEGSNLSLSKQLESANQEVTEVKDSNQQLTHTNLEQTKAIQLLSQQLESANAKLAKFHTERSSCDIEPWKVACSKVEKGAEIARGGWGTISKGTVSVAIKELHGAIAHQSYIDQFRREMQILSQIRHSNLVQFIGAVFDQPSGAPRAIPLIIIELLDTNLRSAYEKEQLRDDHKLPIFKDVAKALKYLHERYDPIIHRDVSAPNVLLEALPGGKWKGKLSDLGSANYLKNAQTHAPGAILYAAPETFPTAYNPDAPPVPQTFKLDVYSFGVMLCEVMTDRFPKKEDYGDMLRQVQRTCLPIYNLIRQCTEYKQENRPAMAVVLTTLDNVRYP